MFGPWNHSYPWQCLWNSRFCWNSGSWRMVPSETLGNKQGTLCSWGFPSAEGTSSREKLTEMTALSRHRMEGQLLSQRKREKNKQRVNSMHIQHRSWLPSWRPLGKLRQTFGGTQWYLGATINLFNKDLPSTYSVPTTILYAGKSSMRHHDLYSPGFYILGKADR